MKDIKTREDIIKDLNNNMSKYEELVKAWEKVKRVYKKDGKPFKNIGKNFTNCKITVKDYTLKSYKDEQLTVYSENFTDSIDILQLVKYCKIKPEENRIIDEPYVENYFFLNVEELEEIIKERISLFKSYIKEYERLLLNVHKYCDILEPLINTINETLKDTKKLNHDCKYSNSLTYDLESMIKNNIKTW